MKRRAAQAVSIFVGDVKPLDARFVQIVCDYLDRVHDHITSKTEPRHIRLLFARRPRVSNTEAQAIGTAFRVTPRNNPVLPRWVQDSVVLWHRELAKAVIVERGLTDPQKGVAPAISPARDNPALLPHQVFFGKGCHSSSRFTPS